MIIIVDSGSTKTLWFYYSEQSKGIIKTNGLHPSMLDHFSAFDYQQISPLSNKSGEIFFYGTGCLAETNRLKVGNWLKNIFPLYEITVQSDLTGTGLALLGNENGFVGILGTGSSMAIWEKQTITVPIPSLGWAFVDEGSGTDIARRFFKCWYSGKFSSKLNSVLEQNPLFPKPANLIEQIYKTVSANKTLAYYCIEIAKLAEYESVRNIIVNAFNDYFDYYEKVLLSKKKYSISFSGSIAYTFEHILNCVAKMRGYELLSIIKDPVDNLIKYHLHTPKELL